MPIYQIGDIESVLMTKAIKRLYYYYLVSKVAYNVVQHFHSQLLDIHGEPIQANLKTKIKREMSNSKGKQNVFGCIICLCNAINAMLTEYFAKVPSSMSMNNNHI